MAEGKVLKAIVVDEEGNTQGSWTKQLPEDPFSAAYQHSGIIEPPHDVGKLMVMAESHPTHSAVIEQKAADIVGSGWEWIAKDKETREGKTDTRDQLENWFDELANDGETDETNHDILLAAVDDMETFGQGFVELARDTQGKLQYWFRIPAHTIRFHKDGVRMLQKRNNKQRWFKRYIPGDQRLVDAQTGKILGAGGGQAKPGEEVKKAKNVGKVREAANELLVLRRPSRRSSFYGIPRYISATGWIALSLAARDDSILFFQNHREPRWVIILENVEDDPALEDMIKDAFRHGVAGREAHSNVVLPLSGGAKATFQKLGNDGMDASWENLQDRVDGAVLVAHRMPGERVGMVRAGPLGGNAVTAATANYKESFVQSSQGLLASRINAMVRAESGVEGDDFWSWAPKELDVAEIGVSIDQSVKAFQGGVLMLDEARERINEEPLPDDDERGKKFFFQLAPPPAGGLPADQGSLQQGQDELARKIDTILSGN